MELITPSPTPELNKCVNVRSAYHPGEFSELRQRTLQKEKNKKKAAILIGKLTKHSIIVRKGRIFLIIVSLITLVSNMYLLHMESLNRHLQNPVTRTAGR
jgi:hypothetical protein